MKNGKPYKYTSKDRLKKSSGFNSPKTKEKKKKNDKTKSTDNTIKIDLERLNDLDLLDTSFLEGRVDSSVTKPKNPKIIRKEKDKKIIDSNKLLTRVHFLRNLFFGLALVCIFILATVYSFNFFKKTITNVLETRLDKEDIVEKEENIKVDRNYLFVGDYFTDEYIFSKYGHDYHYVKSGKRDLTTQDILNNSKEYIYDYNPSMVFIEVGLYDICNSVSVDDIISNINDIVNNIKLNRPNAKIYIESIYPINSSIDNYELKPFEYDLTNEEINNVNSELELYCKDNKIKYLDINSILSKKGKLDKAYTENGFSLNNAGYKQVNKYIRKIIGE